MKKFGLLGYPLTHSFSKDFFNEKFLSEKVDAVYINFPIEDIASIRTILLTNPELEGLNVTIPHKVSVLKYLDEIEPTAQAIGAVNVIKIIRGGNGSIKLKGYNSDVTGFVDSISYLIQPQHKKALILGTGGASKAVKFGLETLGIASTFVSRTPQKGQFGYDDLSPNIMEEYTVIINTTPLGMYPDIDTCPLIPYGLLTKQHLVYDLLYNPDITLFMQKAAEVGAATKNGLEMLLLQASISWDIWQNKR